MKSNTSLFGSGWRFFSLPVILLFIVSIVATLAIGNTYLTPQASAKKLTGNALEKQANKECETRAKKDKVASDEVDYWVEKCVTNYLDIYGGSIPNPTDCQQMVADPSTMGGVRFSGIDPACKAGQELGEAAAKKDGGNDEQSMRDVCLGKKGGTRAATDAEIEACQKGYKGAKNNKTEEEACKDYNNEDDPNAAPGLKATCLAGYGAQKSKKTEAVIDTAAIDSGAADDDTQSNANCQDTNSGDLGWILCPIYDGLAYFSDWVLTTLIAPLLETEPIPTTPGNKIYDIWSSFRVYANIFLVIVMLIMVFGQAIGGGLVEAYTAKKALPRILAAAVLVNLSIYIVAFGIDVTNVVGKGINGLMTAPLADQGAFNIQLNGGQAAAAGTAAVVTGGITAIVIAGGIAGPLVAWLMVFLVLPAAIGLIMAFVTILIRQAIILGLVLVAPVAFVLWCLPNTEKYFKTWWDLFLKMLIVYPIIMMIFAICDILAVTAAGG